MKDVCTPLNSPGYNTRAALIHRTERRSYWSVRLFLTQSDLSVENGVLRLKPKLGFLTVEKEQIFSTEFSDRRIQSKNLTFSTESICRSKNSVEKVLHVFF